MIPRELSKKRVFHFTTALVSLVPRQIMLGTKNEEKVQKGLSQTLDANNGAKKGGGGEGDERLLLLRSIAAFLESNGFSRSLKRFRSEAEIDTGKGQSWDLEHVFHEYIKKRGHPAEADVDCLKMQGSDNFKSPPVPNTSDSQPAETVTSKDKKEKKKKCKSVSENSELESAPQAVNTGKKEDSVDHETNGYLNKSDPGKENRSILNKGVDKHLDKTSKKRKRLGIEKSKSQFENETLTKKSKKRKSKDSENNVETGLYTERSQLEEGHLGHDKKRKVDKFQEDLNKSLKVPLDDQTVGQIGDKEHQIFERNNVNNTTDKREPVKLGKNEGKHSAEPKTVNPFQRVKVDEVKFSDERLQNNSYWAKGGADGGYGAKAQEILGQVKGRGFRHEKTKKKRGTYRGGIIDLQSHSIKFNYSDDD